MLSRVGGVCNSGTATLTNTIVGDVVGPITGSNNLIGGDPLLGPLADNGGPTPTMALLPGSPVINAGSNALIPIDPATGQPYATDQRGFGFDRIVGGTVDIGAYELQSIPTTTATTMTVTPSLAAPVYGQTLTFTATVSAAGATPTGTVQFTLDGSPFGAPVPLDASGHATSGGISRLAATGHTIAATYLPTGAFSTSTSGTTTFTIGKATVTGNATTQDALNLAKQGKLSITVSNVAGLVNGDTLADFLSHAHYFITFADPSGTRQYEFCPTAVTTSGGSITVTYNLKDPTLADKLAAELADNTSAATSAQAGFMIDSGDYTLTDDYLTRLVSSAK